MNCRELVQNRWKSKEIPTEMAVFTDKIHLFTPSNNVSLIAI
jgi:hypothetical protein